jgi:hypothetical protein
VKEEHNKPNKTRVAKAMAAHTRGGNKNADSREGRAWKFNAYVGRTTWRG